MMLYLWDGDSVCLRYATAVSPAVLTSVLELYELGDTVFAWDCELPYSNVVSPCALFPDPLPALPVLNAGKPALDTDELLAQLQFNPHTNYRYTEAAGTEVITENDRSLRIAANGLISYRSGGEALLTIGSSETPTAAECAAGCSALLDTLTLSRSGSARLYLKNIQQSGTQTTLYYGYQVDGVPVLFADESPAAVVQLSGSTVSSLTLRLRQYTASDKNSLVLPLRQTLAIAAQQQSGNLSIGYTDSADATVSAGWLAY